MVKDYVYLYDCLHKHVIIGGNKIEGLGFYYIR